MPIPQPFLDELQAVVIRALGAGATVSPSGPGRARVGPAAGGYSVLVPELVAIGGRLGALVATDRRGLGEGLLLEALILFDTAGALVEVSEPFPGPGATLRSITARVPAAHWQEREVAEMFGLELVLHPDAGRRLLHEHTPPGDHPLLRDRDAAQRLEFAAASPPAFRQVRGEGVHEIPVGPIHAGIIEPGHFRFFVLGERILHLDIRLGYQHKGTEKLFEGKPLGLGVHLAERISGDTTFGHALAYCQAVESLCKVSIPARAVWLRALALELERLANHVGDLGALCGDIGYAFGASHFSRLRGEFLNKSELVSGNRYLRGLCCLGGVRFDLEDAMARELERWLPRVRVDFEEVADIALEADSVAARFEGVGTLSPRAVRDLGIVGPAARASGVALDVRADFKCEPYRDLGFSPVLEPSGDVMSRARVRFREAQASLEMMVRLLASMPRGATRAPLSTPAPFAMGIGHVEGWRGEILTCAMAGPDGQLWRVRTRDPSVQNWLGLAQAVEMNLVSDFPLCNKSFNLSYSGSDL
ncbi:MAG: NADH-quinone oxidoreductase subunit C [Candidatus Wallbacteria bacterium]|nr:NADH-quinone oxidoreductase subunit C [Candidatus Wallbacteria bacterium]